MLSLKDIYKYAHKGVPEWQYFLGYLFENGDVKRGIPRDILESIKWYREASFREHPRAMNQYAVYNYKKGYHDIAYKYFKKSYLLGDIIGKYNYSYFCLQHPQSIKDGCIPDIIFEFEDFVKSLKSIGSNNFLIDNIDTIITSLKLLNIKNNLS